MLKISSFCRVSDKVLSRVHLNVMPSYCNLFCFILFCYLLMWFSKIRGQLKIIRLFRNSAIYHNLEILATDFHILADYGTLEVGLASEKR